MDIVEGWIIGSAMDKTFAAAQENLCQSQWQRALVAEAFGRPIGERPLPGENRVTAGRAGHLGRVSGSIVLVCPSRPGVTLVSEEFRSIGKYQPMAFGLILIASVLLMPTGLVGAAQGWRERSQRRRQAIPLPYACRS
jgi:hypothetical protein